MRSNGPRWVQNFIQSHSGSVGGIEQTGHTFNFGGHNYHENTIMCTISSSCHNK